MGFSSRLSGLGRTNKSSCCNKQMSRCQQLNPMKVCHSHQGREEIAGCQGGSFHPMNSFYTSSSPQAGRPWGGHQIPMWPGAFAEADVLGKRIAQHQVPWKPVNSGGWCSMVAGAGLGSHEQPAAWKQVQSTRFFGHGVTLPSTQ